MSKRVSKRSKAVADSGMCDAAADTAARIALSSPDEAYFDLINELLQDCPPGGAYAMGRVSVDALRQNLRPTRALLEAASKCTSIEEADQVFADWLEGMKNGEP